MLSPLHIDFHHCFVLHHWEKAHHLNDYSSPNLNILSKLLAHLILKKWVFTLKTTSNLNSNLASNSRKTLKNPCLRPNPSTLPLLKVGNCSKKLTLRTLLDTAALHSYSQVKPNCNQSRPFGQMVLVYMIFLDHRSRALHLHFKDDLLQDDGQNLPKLVWRGPCKRLVALLDPSSLDCFQILNPRFDWFVASILTSFEMCPQRRKFHYFQISTSEIQISHAVGQLISLGLPFAIHSPIYSSVLFDYPLRSQKICLSLCFLRNSKR